MLDKLAKQTAIYGISTILGRFLSYMLTPFYTRIFGLESYGIITDIYALIPFALVVLTLGMESGLFRFSARAEQEGGDVASKKRRTFATMWTLTSAAALLFWVVIYLFNGEVSALMGEVYAANPQYVIIVATIVTFDVIGCIPFSRLREQGRAVAFVSLKLLNIALQVALAFAFWGMGLFDSPFGVGWAFVANLAASIITTLLVVGLTATLPRIDRSILLPLFAYSMPLLISGIAGTANEFIDRQLIKYLVPSGAMAQLGIYGAITKIAVVMTLFTQTYRLAAEPFFLANYRRDEFVEMNAAAMKYFVMASMVIMLGITLFSDLFALIVGSEFRTGIDILPIILFANMLCGVWLNLSFWYKREERTYFALWVTLSGLVASVAFGWLLIPRMGFEGAAWSRLATESVMVVVSLALTRIFYPVPYDWRRIVELCGVALAIYCTARWLDVENGIVRYATHTVLFVIYVAYVVRREHIDIKGLLKAALKRR